MLSHWYIYLAFLTYYYYFYFLHKTFFETTRTHAYVCVYAVTWLSILLLMSEISNSFRDNYNLVSMKPYPKLQYRGKLQKSNMDSSLTSQKSRCTTKKYIPRNSLLVKHIKIREVKEFSDLMSQNKFSPNTNIYSAHGQIYLWNLILLYLTNVPSHGLQVVKCLVQYSFHIANYCLSTVK